MKLRFLGTSAGELYPGVWCRCANCAGARSSADPRDRRQSAALYVEPAEGAPLLVDFPPEIASQAERHRVPLPDVERLLVTHSHGDHWFPYQLRWRGRPPETCGEGEPATRAYGAPRFTELPLLTVHGNAAVEAVLRRELGDNLDYYALAFERAEAGFAFVAGAFTVTPFAANHDIGREDALHYVLDDGERKLLYALDGDTFVAETRERLRGVALDAVVMEATYGFGPGTNHRDFARLIEEAAWLRSDGTLAADGQVIATHFSPHHCPLHAETSRYLADHGIVAAWDGMEVGL